MFSFVLAKKFVNANLFEELKLEIKKEKL